MKVGIAIDTWKLSIFERHLKQAGYTFVNAGAMGEGVTLLKVDTTNPDALHTVVKTANTEAARTGNVQ